MVCRNDGKMAARYGHFSMEELRGAVETISGPKVTRNFQRSQRPEFKAVRLTD
jgi:hypothetical protein